MAIDTGGSPKEGAPDGWVDRAYTQVLAIDDAGLEHTLWQAAMTLGSQPFLDDVVGSLLTQIGEGWVKDEITPAQEHLSTGIIIRILQRFTDQSRSRDGSTLVVATLPGERHSLGVQLASAVAIFEGWRVTYLGTDLPVADIVETAEGVHASAVAISIVTQDNSSDTVSLVGSLRKLLDPRVDVLVGGGAVAKVFEDDPIPRGVIVFNELDELREFLRK